MSPSIGSTLGSIDLEVVVAQVVERLITVRQIPSSNLNRDFGSSSTKKVIS